MSTLETLKQIIEDHRLVHIASIDEKGLPCVRGVDYASDDKLNIYFMTHKDTRKVAQLKNNEQVSFVIDHDCASMDDLMQLKYVKGSGVAEEVTAPETIQMAFGLLAQKMPFLTNLPFNPADMRVFKVIPTEVLVTDNTISFGHTEIVHI
ncbi:pyridoxamine 5'-phosphate oxidase family protein [Mangrovibacterium sp.]|uniref:pyridoxamine 5'-phosphate oxidase family protein n=1 Tax=Mangrovibacterium sp. TaxID=1961364 RepID=UPI003565B21F